MFETFEKAEVGIPGRDGDHLYQFLPLAGVYMIEGSYLVEVQEIPGGDGEPKRVIILSMLDSETPIKAYIIKEPRFEDKLYFDATNIKVYIGFKKKKQKVFDITKDEKKIIHSELPVSGTGIEAAQFELKFIHKAAHRLE